MKRIHPLGKLSLTFAIILSPLFIGGNQISYAVTVENGENQNHYLSTSDLSEIMNVSEMNQFLASFYKMDQSSKEQMIASLMSQYNKDKAEQILAILNGAQQLSNLLQNQGNSTTNNSVSNYNVEVLRDQILRQTGTSVIAQANQVPQTVLNKLK